MRNCCSEGGGWRRPSRIAPTTSATCRCATSKVGDLYRALGQGEQARQSYLQSLAIRERLAQAEPDRADYQRDLSVSYNKVGDLYRDLGQGEQARQSYLQSLGHSRAIGAGRAGSRGLPARPVGVPTSKVGDLYRDLGQGEQARQSYLQSLAIAERLAQAEPDRADYQRDLSVAYNKVGDLYRDLGQGEQARQSYLQSLAIRSGWRRPSRIAPTTSATCRCPTSEWETCTRSGPGGAGAPVLPAVAGHSGAVGAGGAGSRRLPARPLDQLMAGRESREFSHSPPSRA